MEDIGLVILFSGLAGAVTVVGIALTRRWHAQSLRYSHYINSFAAGLILTVALFDLFPKALEASHLASLWVLAGFIIFLVFEDFLIFHSGAEVHYPERREGVAKGLVYFWGLLFHSFLDGLVIAVGFAADDQLGLMISMAVISHEFPEGITTFSLLLKHIDARRALWLALAVAVATPAGGLAGALFIPPSEALMGGAAGLVAGSFIYISATDIVPEIREAKAFQNTLALLAGSVFLFLIHLFLDH
jgi:zinc transporter ZupT